MDKEESSAGLKPLSDHPGQVPNSQQQPAPMQDQIISELNHQLRTLEKQNQELRKAILAALLLAPGETDITSLGTPAEKEAAIRRQVEQALSDSDERLLSLFEKMLTGFALLDIIRDDNDLPQDYRFLAVNPAFEKATGLSGNQVVGRTLHELFPQTENHWFTIFERAAFIRQESPLEAYCEQLDKYFEILTYSPNTRQLALMLNDITHHREAEEGARVSEMSLRAIFNNFNAAIFIHDAEGRLIDCNDMMLEMYRISREKALTLTIAADYSSVKNPLEKLAGYWQRTLEGGNPLFEWIARRPLDGSEFDVEVYLSKIRLKNDDLFMAVVRDISDRKALERERQAIEARVLHSQTLQSLGVLAGGVAHDFNNLLTGILGNADLALLGLPQNSSAEDSIKQIIASACRAAELTKQLLAYSGKGKFVVSSIQLSEMITEMSELLEVSIYKKIILRRNLKSDLPGVEGDISQLRQVVMNLVINAAEAIGIEPGVITIKTDEMECDQAYLAGSFLDEDLPCGKYVTLDISDTGNGMTAETKARIFDPFFSTKATGRGLGLSAVLGIVRGHHGAIRVYSEPGRGSTFRILFPALEEPIQQRSGQKETFPAFSGGGTILIVEDEEMVRTLTRKMLEISGFHVIEALHGREAVEIFQARSQDIHAVLLDLTMPEMDGEDAFRALRQIRPGIPVILTSGYNEQDTTTRFSGKGLSGFLQKPFNMQQLLEALRNALEKS